MNLRERSYAVLLAGAREVTPGVPRDKRGYTKSWQNNLLNGLPLAEIAADLGHGAGKELEGKLCAAHSSAALAVNTFGPWRTDPATLRLCGRAAFRSIKFETVCPTVLGGTAPHLDLLADGDAPVGVESKCTEWMEPKEAKFSSSYERLRPTHGASPWFGQVQELCAHPRRYRYVDAAQLVKHALGLASRYGARPIHLLHLFWEPMNADQWPECHEHREEVEDLSARVRPSSVTLVPVSYGELWAQWERHKPLHLTYLRTRYGREA